MRDVTVYTAVCDDGDFRAALHPLPPVLVHGAYYRDPSPFRVLLCDEDGTWWRSIVGADDDGAMIPFADEADAIAWLLADPRLATPYRKNKRKGGRRA